MPFLSNGETINETYLVKGCIGRGSFGEVFRVEHVHMGSQVLKLLSEEYVSRTNIKTIMAEARILTKFSHPNIVRVYEANSFEREGRTHYYITMGFVPGEPLSQLWERKSPLRMPVALKIQREILAGLQAAHDHDPPIIHRDINGDNILLSYADEEPCAVLSDFGLAKAVDAVSWSEDSAGRYSFLAPECFFGSYLPASDVFSAGIVFYRMVTGVFPWQYDFGVGDDTGEIQTAVLEGRKKTPVNPSVHNSACGRFVEQVILQSLAGDLTKRFQSAGEFLDALDEKKASRISAFTKPTKQQRTSAVCSSNEVKGGLNDVAGMESLKEMLRNDVIGPLEDRELYEQYKLTIPNGLLLYGPPGCGKTYIARKFAVEVGYHFIEVKPSDVGSKYIHGSQEKIARLFKTAKENAPTILFIDELDALVPSRDQDIHHSYASEVNEFLSQMNDCSQNDVFVIGATNRPERVDAAILRTGRMDKIEYVPPPDFAARKSMFEHHLKDRPCERDLNFGKFADLTEGFVASDIKFLADEASRLALKERSKIGEGQVEHAIQASAPSISAQQLHKYKVFASSRSFS